MQDNSSCHLHVVSTVEEIKCANSLDCALTSDLLEQDVKEQQAEIVSQSTSITSCPKHCLPHCRSACAHLNTLNLKADGICLMKPQLSLRALSTVGSIQRFQWHVQILLLFLRIMGFLQLCFCSIQQHSRQGLSTHNKHHLLSGYPCT